METDLLEFLRAWRAHVGRLEREAQPLMEDSPQSFHFADQIEQFDPFKKFASSRVYEAGVSSSGGKTISGKWAWRRLLKGDALEAIIANAQKEIDSNQFEATEVWPVSGIIVDTPVYLADGMSLVPNDTLRKNRWHRWAFTDTNFGFDHPKKTAALISSYSISPALVPMSDGQDFSAAIRDRQARASQAMRARLALGLASGGAVEMPFVYAQVDEASIFGDCQGGAQYTPWANDPTEDRRVDVDLARSVYGQLKGMESPRALELSIDRLLRSRTTKSPADQIIDLGMAAEIALMHAPNGGANSGTGEITYKISSRAAWMVGGKPDIKAETFKTISELYSARSRVVHTGEAKSSDQSKIPLFDEVVTRILRALLDLSRFPDWKLLVLGFETGGDQRAIGN